MRLTDARRSNLNAPRPALYREDGSRPPRENPFSRFRSVLDLERDGDDSLSRRAARRTRIHASALITLKENGRAERAESDVLNENGYR